MRKRALHAAILFCSPTRDSLLRLHPGRRCAPRVLECPVQLEAVVESTHAIAAGDEALRGRVVAFEVRIQRVHRVHLEQSILADGEPDRIDPDRWRPLIMSFQKFYRLAPGQLHASALGQIREAMYRTPDVDRARAAVRTAARSTRGW